MRKPNFFIVGAPKSGTTAMSEYLRTHPNVFMCNPKEPSFFSTDVEKSNYRSEKEYMDLFSTARSEQTVIAEASTNYLHSKVALKKIKHFQPDAKILVMLRRPSDLVYAFHGELFKIGKESEPSFEEAWRLQIPRAKGEFLPKMCKDAHSLQYRWIGSLGTQLESLFEIFPRKQICIVIFDDFRANPGHEYRRVLNFLDLPDVGRESFPAVNEATQFRWTWLGRLVPIIGVVVARPLSILRRRTSIRGTGLLKLLDRFNAVPTERPSLGDQFQRHLDDVFVAEIKLLENLLDRDLGGWYGLHRP